MKTKKKAFVHQINKSLKKNLLVKIWKNVTIHWLDEKEIQNNGQNWFMNNEIELSKILKL